MASSPSRASSRVKSWGIYQLVLRLNEPRTIAVGRLGVFFFPAGHYVYTGSARGGFSRRIPRHLRRDKKLRWHIDHLLLHAQMVCVYKYPGQTCECCLNRQAEEEWGGIVIAPRFGSTDCSCKTHLFYLGRRPPKRKLSAPHKQASKIGEPIGFLGTQHPLRGDTYQAAAKHK